MKTTLLKATAIFGLVFGVLVSGFAPAASAHAQLWAGNAAINQDANDFPVIEVSNYTRCPNSADCWSSSISDVRPGDTIAFVMYAHNTGDADASNVRLSIDLRENGSQMNAYGRITADNSNTVAHNNLVTFNSDVDTPVSLTFVGGEFYQDSSVDPTGPDSLPSGQSLRQVTQGGVNIGTLPRDPRGTYVHDVQLVVRYRVDGTSDTCDGGARLEVTPSSDTIDVDETAHYRATYDSNGNCSGGQTDVTDVADWSVDNSSIASDLDDGDFRGRRDGSTTVRADYRGLTDTASLRVRDNGDNDSCDDDRATLVIVPYTATFSVGQTYQYRALYDSDGPGCSGGERDVTNSADWTSRSSGIATSLDDGRFRGVRAGYAPIEARYSGITATAQANVIGQTVITEPPVIQQPPVVLPPTVIGGGTVIQRPVVGTVTAGVADQGVACITVTPSVDVTSMLPAQDFVYTTLYRNDCPFALNNAVLRVFIPNDVEFKASSNPFFIREGQKFSYNIGTLPPGGQGSVAISGFVRKDAQIGDTETFTSTIEFLDSTNRIQGTTSYLVAVLGGDIRRTLSASLMDTLGHIFGSGWLWMLIALIVLVALAWFVISMILRRRTVATSKVVVAPSDDPLRALRNA